MKKIHTPKLLICLLMLASVIFQACDNSNEKPNSNKSSKKTDWLVADSARMLQYDTLYKFALNSIADGSAESKIISPGIVDKFEKLRYSTINGKLVEARISVSKPDLEFNMNFVLKDEKIGWARLRHWVKVDSSFAEETFYFFDKDTLFYASEKSLSLSPGESPLMMGQLPHSPSKRSQEELTREIQEYWQPVFRAIKEDMISTSGS